MQQKGISSLEEVLGFVGGLGNPAEVLEDPEEVL